MSFENEGLPVTWEEIKAASRKLDWAGKGKAEMREKRAAREYLAHTECEDARVQEHIAIPGYN
jgi:hypothetical protein